jgi:copper chaperone CopZ
MTTTVRVAGMNAVHAVRAIETALAAVRGIVKLDVRLGVVVIEHDGRARPDALRAAIEAAGFSVAGIQEDTRRLPTRPMTDDG